MNSLAKQKLSTVLSMKKTPSEITDDNIHQLLADWEPRWDIHWSLRHLGVLKQIMSNPCDDTRKLQILHSLVCFLEEFEN